MKPPICTYEIDYTSRRMPWGTLHEEAVAMIRPCGHLHHDYADFDERLQRLHPGLHLGFDLKRTRWVIYKWTIEQESIPLGGGNALVHAQKMMDVVIRCEGNQPYKSADGGWRDNIVPVPFGDWVLIDIARSTSDRFVQGSGWAEREIKRIHDTEDARAQKKMLKKTDAWVNDMASLRDRGNPNFRRKQFRQRKVRANHPVKAVA